MIDSKFKGGDNERNNNQEMICLSSYVLCKNQKEACRKHEEACLTCLGQWKHLSNIGG
jgi:hypothetical protein